MSVFTTQTFAAALTADLPSSFAGKLCVAFSGGLDSTVLLHALAELRHEHSDWRLRAIHIDHQLQTDSKKWAEHCQRAAVSLGIEFLGERVTVARDGQGLEAAARKARHAAFRQCLHDNEILVTAHHADDQAETILLALLRGSGVQGLAAMPALKTFGRGWHLRPLLTFTRESLEAWAHERRLSSVADPSNALLRHDRNYLRHEVLPQLRKRWPAVAANLGRSANHFGEAVRLLAEVGDKDLQACRVGDCLAVDGLRALSSERCRNVLRYWLRLRGLTAPSTRKLAGLMHDLFNTDLDRILCVTWQGAELRSHRGLLYADPPQQSLAMSNCCEQHWSWHDACELPAGLGRLSMQPTPEPGLSIARLPERLTIRFRRGGEKIRLPGREHRSALRNLLQETDALPWWRDRLPLVYAGKELVAVGDLYWSNEFAASAGEAAAKIVWEGAPPWRAVHQNG